MIKKDNKQIVILFSILPSIIICFMTSKQGIGLSTDSVGYIKLAKDISNTGLNFLFNNQAVIQPPFYPIVLAVVSYLFRIKLETSAIIINCFCASIIMLIFMRLKKKILDDNSYFLLAGLFMLFSKPLNMIYSYAWTEPIFVMLTFLCFFLLLNSTINLKKIFILSLLVSFTILTRYAGITLIPLFTLYLFIFASENKNINIKYAIVYFTTTTTIFTLYMIRNHVVSGTFIGTRVSPSDGCTVFTNMDFATIQIIQFFSHQKVTSNITLLIFIFFSIGMFISKKINTIKINFKKNKKSIFLFSTHTTIYTSFIIISSTTTAYDFINFRLLSPIFPTIILLFVYLLPLKSKKNNFYYAIILCLILVHPALSSTKRIFYNFKYGLDYNSTTWKKNEVVKFLNSSDQKIILDKNLFSNQIEALYILTDIEATRFPSKKFYRSDKTTGITPANIFEKYPNLNNAIYIHFKKTPEYLYSNEELKETCNFELLYKFKDGEIYKIHKL